jgi:hypothetical protein
LPLEHAGMSLLPILKGEIQARPIVHGIGIHGSFPYGYAPMQETRGFFERHYFLTNKLNDHSIENYQDRLGTSLGLIKGWRRFRVFVGFYLLFQGYEPRVR